MEKFFKMLYFNKLEASPKFPMHSLGCDNIIPKKLNYNHPVDHSIILQKLKASNPAGHSIILEKVNYYDALDNHPLANKYNDGLNNVQLANKL
jgi:hypothetical protein